MEIYSQLPKEVQSRFFLFFSHPTAEIIKDSIFYKLRALNRKTTHEEGSAYKCGLTDGATDEVPSKYFPFPNPYYMDSVGKVGRQIMNKKEKEEYFIGFASADADGGDHWFREPWCVSFHIFGTKWFDIEDFRTLFRDMKAKRKVENMMRELEGFEKREDKRFFKWIEETMNEDEEESDPEEHEEED